MPITSVPLDLIDDNPWQPRGSYSTKKVEELAYSIKENGLRQIPEARPVNGRYQLAYGHYRKRAFKKLAKDEPAKWGTMPLEVKEVSDKDMVILALEENLRRDDITPLDLARSVEMYLTAFPEETETALAKRLNQTQGNIANMRRVLKCPPEVLERVAEGAINFTMARELLIFQGLNAGIYQEWSAKEQRSVEHQKDEADLMKQAIEGLRTGNKQYGAPCTVEGIKRSIDQVAAANFRHLEKGDAYYRRESQPLFDTRVAGCLKCSKMIRTYRTQTEARHFCTDFACWDGKQNEHKRQQSALAKKQMEEDVARRVAQAEAARRKRDISQEIPSELREVADARGLDEEAGLEILEDSEVSKDLPKFRTLEEVCQGCLNQGVCDRTHKGVASFTGEDQHLFVCPQRVTKDTMNQVKERAKVKMPDSFKALVDEKAGTRAEVLDLRELRLNRYGSDLKAGHVLLSGGYNKTLEVMEDPVECTERCTTGFHYAFDSSEADGKVYFVCTEPKCAAKKKAALTRAQHAEGQAKKRAEAAAIKQAVAGTVTLDRPRMKLILLAQLEGRHARASPYSKGSPTEWFAERLKLEPAGQPHKMKEIMTAADQFSDADLAKLIVEFMLSMLTYSGEIEDYEVRTTEALNWMGVGVAVEK